jgi:hypothetical protein
MVYARVYAAVQGDEEYVLKRMMVEKGADVALSGQRERYFGELFRGAANGGDDGEGGVGEDGDEEGDGEERAELLRTAGGHLGRYVESFEVAGGSELWLVFRDEGASLHSLMYEAAGGPRERGLKVLQPSRWWLAMRRRHDGHETVLDLVRQVGYCHCCTSTTEPLR